MDCVKRKLKFLNESDKESVEEYFFKYAFPCMMVIVKRGGMAPEKFREILNNYKKGFVPDKKELEGIFEAAFRRLDILGREMNKNKWDIDVIEKYWKEQEHNRFIEEKEGGYSETSEDFNELCKIHKAEITDILGDMYRVRYDGGKTRNVFNMFVPEAKIGDKVTIHFFYAVEKIE